MHHESAQRTLLADEGGATAIEYGLIAALVAITLVSGLFVLRGALLGTWTLVANEVSSVG